jgi:hypothetical protein
LSLQYLKHLSPRGDSILVRGEAALFVVLDRQRREENEGERADFMRPASQSRQAGPSS